MTIRQGDQMSSWLIEKTVFSIESLSEIGPITLHLERCIRFQV